MDIITEFIRSPEMCEHLKKAPLTIWALANLIINAPESISSKQLALRSLLPTRNEETAALINKYIREIDAAWYELLHLDGAVLNLIECWYDDEMLCEKKSTGMPFTSFETAIGYIHQLMIAEEWDDDTTCWTVIEKWAPAENGQVEKTYEYTLIKDTIVDFACYNTDTNIKVGGRTFRKAYRNPLDADLNLPIPFKPGDIIALDCRPFAPVKPALLLEVSDDCCGVQMIFEHDGQINNPVYGTAALKHGHGFTDFRGCEYFHPLSYLYNLQRIIPDDLVNICPGWVEQQFKEALPSMQKAIRENHSPEIAVDVLKRFYLAKYYLYNND